MTILASITGNFGLAIGAAAMLAMGFWCLIRYARTRKRLPLVAGLVLTFVLPGCLFLLVISGCRVLPGPVYGPPPMPPHHEDVTEPGKASSARSETPTPPEPPPAPPKTNPGPRIDPPVMPEMTYGPPSMRGGPPGKAASDRGEDESR